MFPSSSPTTPPAPLYVATRQYALPQEPTTRARALIEHLLADYALPDSKHPLQTGAAVDDVFLLALPIANPPAILPSGAMLAPSSGRVAVINLRAAFVENHPSGIEVEDLTVRSIIGTLHSNIPDLTEVRFLVDGQPRETLAGHADLARHLPHHRRRLPSHPTLKRPHPGRPRYPAMTPLAAQSPAQSPAQPTRPGITIGVFDSGFGGLTVLRALLARIPSARYLYLGDTARLPYGSKSPETVARYAVSATQFLIDQAADLLVIACNTATALALPEITPRLRPHPRLRRHRTRRPRRPARHPSQRPSRLRPRPRHRRHRPIPRLLLALESLGLSAAEQACPLLVPLVEEGWLATDDHADPAREAVTQAVLRIYLTEALAAATDAQTLLLGCTHYPLLRLEIAQTLADLGRPLHIIDSAEATADAVAAHLHPIPATNAAATCTFYATDSVEKFGRLGPHFLGRPLPQVHLIHLAE